MNKQMKYQAKAAAMPQARINPIVLAIALTMAMLAILAASIGAQAQGILIKELNWVVDWRTSSDQTVVSVSTHQTRQVQIVLGKQFETQTLTEAIGTSGFSASRGINEGVKEVRFTDRGMQSGSYWDKSVCPTAPSMNGEYFHNRSLQVTVVNNMPQKLYAKNLLENSSWYEIDKSFSWSTMGNVALVIKLAPTDDAPACAGIWWGQEATLGGTYQIEVPSQVVVGQVFQIKYTRTGGTQSVNLWTNVPRGLALTGFEKCVAGEGCVNYLFFQSNPQGSTQNIWVNARAVRAGQFAVQFEISDERTGLRIQEEVVINAVLPQQPPVTLVIPDTTTVVGNEVIVPVSFRGNTGSIFSIDARVNYSNTHLVFAGIDQQGTLSQGFQYVLNTNTLGSVIVTGQGTQPITAESGLMLRLKFRAQRAGNVPVTLVGVQTTDPLINGGAIPVVGEYGQVKVNASEWTGAVYFWNGPKVMKDVTVTLTNGTDVVTGTTGWDGGYTVALPATGTWTASFSKPKSESDRHAVSSLDAALTHRRAALLTSFGIPFMEWSSDADNRAPITSYDANRILRYVARYVDNDAVCGEWRAESITVEVTGPNSAGHISKMWMMCDVTGNWVPDGTVRAAEVAETPNITTTVISVEPLVLRVSSDQPFSGVSLQFDQDVQAVTATGFDTVEPNGGLVPLASMTDSVNSVDLTIVPEEGTKVLSLNAITVDEFDAVSGPTMALEPQFPLPCVVAPDSCSDMQISLSLEPSEVEPGDMITVTAVVTNAGPANVTASLSVEVPSYVAVNDLKELAAGESYTWQQSFQAILGGPVKAMVASDATELRPGNEEATVNLTVMPALVEPYLYFLPAVMR